ncbi:MAG: SCO family protein [Candidatus Margulisbacteria bacterium]|nr:SCO family protein [Candidatus Margulisiibacteriota bacterium]
MLLNTIVARSFFLFLSVLFSTGLLASMPDVGIKEMFGKQIPLETSFLDHNGHKVQLKNYFHGKPVILSLAYYGCPMLCNLVTTGLLKGVNGVPLELGKDYEIISLSFDPKDTPKVAAEFRGKYVSGLNNPNTETGWHFLTGSSQAVKYLADSVGFKYEFDKKTGEFAHGAALIVLMPDGRVSRYLYGIEFKPMDLRLSLVEAKDKKVISTVEHVMLFCYNYDPNARGYVLAARNVMKIGGFMTLVILGITLLVLHLKKRN